MNSRNFCLASDTQCLLHMHIYIFPIIIFLRMTIVVSPVFYFMLPFLLLITAVFEVICIFLLFYFSVCSVTCFACHCCDAETYARIETLYMFKSALKWHGYAHVHIHVHVHVHIHLLVDFGLPVAANKIRLIMDFN